MKNADQRELPIYVPTYYMYTRSDNYIAGMDLGKHINIRGDYILYYIYYTDHRFDAFDAHFL